MSSRQRIVLLLVAAVVLIGGIAIASSSGGDDDEPASTETTAATPTETTEREPAETGEEPEPEPEAPPQPRVETIKMRDHAPVGDAPRLKYEHGDTIRLRFVSNVADEVHIHGFDRYVQVPARRPTTERFEADLEGIFEVEAHESGELLAELEVRPK